jgi:NADH-quinone oxidoreductase subunit M
MTELHFPWLELSILTPLLGTVVVYLVGQGDRSRWIATAFCTLALLFAVGEFIDFSSLHSFEAHDHWDLMNYLFHQDVFVVDELSAPLLPLTAFVYLVTVLSTLRTKVHRFSFSLTLISESILLATYSCRASWTLVALLALATFPPWIEIRSRGRCSRIYTLHMSAFVIFLFLGYGLHQFSNQANETAMVAGAFLTFAALLRNGIAPVHCWMTDLFEKATFGTAILYVTPLTGAFAVMRLVLPIAPDWVLHWIVLASLITAVYASGMALVQTEARRFFCYLFLSNSSLVLVGLELATPIGLTGALCVWLSVVLSMTGFGLMLRSIEARLGRVSLADYHGLYEQMPPIAGFFLLTGLAAIGFPGTIGFIAVELLVEGAVEVYPQIGTAVVVAAALNGIAILLAYFRIFAGRRSTTPVAIGIRWPERISVSMLSILILGGGLFPQLGVASRYHAALELEKHRLFHDKSPGKHNIVEQLSFPPTTHESTSSMGSGENDAR